MKDIERLLIEAMRAEGESVDPDTHVARQRFLERRRKKRIRFAFSGVTVAAAALAAAVFISSSVPSPVTDDELDLAFAVPAVVATASVPGAPQAAAVVDDGVWVSNATLGHITKVDPDSGAEVATVDVGSMGGGEADEIVAVSRTLVVTTTTGDVLLLDGSTGEFLNPAARGPHIGVDGPNASARPSDTYRLDLDVDGDVVWIADENNGAIHSYFNAGAGKDDFTTTPVDDLAPNDVAAGDGMVFVLDSDRGLVAVYSVLGEAGAPQTLDRATEPFVVPSGNYLDMRYGFGKLWISDESGRIFAFDPLTGEELSVTEVGGRFTDLVVDEESVWGLTGGDGDGGRLVALDPEEGEIRNEGLPITGDPVDVVTGLGSLWVVDRDGVQDDGSGSLLRIDPTGVGTPSPQPEDTSDGEPLSSAEPFIVYSADGDVFIEMTDGTTEQITMTSDAELNPTFGFGSVIFERYDYETSWSGLVEHDLISGEEKLLYIDDAQHPVMSAGGDLAWVNGAGAIELWPDFQSADGKGSKKRIEISLPDGLQDPRSLIFSDDAKYIYYQAFGEGWVTVQLSIDGDGSPSSYVLNGLNEQPPGTTFVQPEDPNGENITVLEVCCRETEGDPYSRFAISRIAFREGAATYESVTGPADLENVDPASLSMVSLHGAVQNADGSWDTFSDEGGSWLVSDGTSIWFLHTGGGGQMAGRTLEPGADLSGMSLSPILEGHN